MSPTRKLVPLVLFVVAGCQTVPSGPAQDFVAATNALARAESAYFDQLQAASNSSHVLIASAVYVRHAGGFPAISEELMAIDDFAKAKALRMAVMAQLQNYAQQVAAITAGASDTSIPVQAKTTTGDVTTLLTDLKAVKLTQQQAGLVQSGVQMLGQAIIAAAASRELQHLAQQAREPIGEIARMIAGDTANIEQDDYTVGLVEDQRTAMLSILAKLYEDPAVNSSQRLAAITEWRDWKPTLVTEGKDIDAALGKLQKANDALAAGQTFSVSLLAQQAFGIATQTQLSAVTGK